MFSARITSRLPSSFHALRRGLSSAAPTITPHYLLFYTYVEDVLEKRGPHRAGHLELVSKMKADGELLMGGAFNDPVDGAAVIFTTKEAAEDFVSNDPYVANGVVTSHGIREWSVVGV